VGWWPLLFSHEDTLLEVESADVERTAMNRRAPLTCRLEALASKMVDEHQVATGRLIYKPTYCST